MGHRDARFIPRFLDTYRNFRSSQSLLTSIKSFLDLMFGTTMEERNLLERF